MATRTSPQLTAHFETDKEGNPRFLQDKGGQKHYQLVFEVENVPKEVYAGTFELDESYYDPVRTVRPEGDERRIRLKTTSYGDYGLRVRLRTSDGEILILDSLVDALQRTRKGMPSNPSVDQAIEELAAH
jgi:hypothetical protein